MDTHSDESGSGSDEGDRSHTLSHSVKNKSLRDSLITEANSRASSPLSPGVGSDGILTTMNLVSLAPSHETPQTKTLMQVAKNVAIATRIYRTESGGATTEQAKGVDYTLKTSQRKITVEQAIDYFGGHGELPDHMSYPFILSLHLWASHGPRRLRSSVLEYVELFALSLACNVTITHLSSPTSCPHQHTRCPRVVHPRERRSGDACTLLQKFENGHDDVGRGSTTTGGPSCGRQRHEKLLC